MTNHCSEKNTEYNEQKRRFYEKQRKERCFGGCYHNYGAANTQGLPRAGNTNMPGWQSTYAYKFTHKILFEKGRHRTLKQNVDVFGTSQCSPNNSLRRPPRN